ncbi:MAG: hypothetical protein GC136_08525 [Alphaproteobacteria bacterium]|nr:hypothetical protein [Alphaproteobacteria bacterium]
MPKDICTVTESNAAVKIESFKTNDIPATSAGVQSYNVLPSGALEILTVSGDKIVIENFAKIAKETTKENTKDTYLQFSDGTVVSVRELAQNQAPELCTSPDKKATETTFTTIEAPEANAVVTTSLPAGSLARFGFNSDEIQSATRVDDDLVITFKNGGSVTIDNYFSTEAGLPAALTLADGTVIDVSELLASYNLDKIQSAAGDEEKEAAEKVAKVEPKAGEPTAEDLANIEPAAGVEGGSAGRGFGFQSVFTPDALGAVPAIGPIGPTALQFGLPEVEEQPFLLNAAPAGIPPVTPPTLFIPPSAQFEDTAQQLLMNVTNNGGANSFLTITVSNIPAGWTVTGAGWVNTAPGAWTVTLPNGVNFTGGPILLPPHDSDIDIPNVDVTVTQTDSIGGGSTSTTQTVTVTVDAVADTPLVNATTSAVLENNPAPLNITTSVTDVDGTEAITHLLISGVPAGFSLNNGAVDMGGGVWQLTPAQLPGLQVTAPTGFYGNVTILVTTVNYDTPTDGELTLVNNENQASQPVTLVYQPVVIDPTVDVAGATDTVVVKEDGTVFMPIVATNPNGVGSVMTVIMTIPAAPGWTIDTTGWTDIGGGQYQIVLNDGADYTGGITLTPPANSDVDFPGNISVSATVADGILSATVTDAGTVIVDAVADTPTINAADNSGVENTALAVNITAALTDLDGSETIVKYQISGVPAGFGFSAGTNLGGGVWEFTPAQIVGLTATAPANYVGTINLTATVFNSETTLSGGETDLTDNDSSNSDPLTLTWTDTPVLPPVVDVAGATNSVIVKEDSSIFMPIVSTNPNGVGSVMVITMTIPAAPGWTINTAGWTSIGGGQYQITLNDGADYTGGITLTPPANSDVDFPGNVSVSSTVTLAGNTATASDAGTVIVDAVADLPTINAADNAGAQNTALAVNVAAAVTDTDGSESIVKYQISGVPAGFGFSAGTNLGGGVWEFTPAQIVGLTATAPVNFMGSITLNATVFNAETTTSGGEPDTADNTNQNSDPLTLTWVGTPVVDVAGNTNIVTTNEDTSVFLPIVATNPNGAGSVMVVTMTIPAAPGWTIDTTGWTPMGGGVYQMTLNNGADYNGGITLTPPTNSDVDFPGVINVQASVTDHGVTVNASDNGDVIVDAVADLPTITADGSTGLENTGRPVTINAAVTDTDGSETITHYQISGVPAGFGFNQGTNLGGGVWQFTPAQIVGLQATAPANYVGTINLTATVFNSETNTSDIEPDLTDNNNQNSDPLSITWTDTPVLPPVVDVAGGTNTVIVKEDNSIFMPIVATNPNGAGSVMVVTMTIPSAPGWTINTAGWTSIGGGQYQLTLNNGADYNGGITLTPPANSDVDFPGNVSVTAAVTLAGNTVSATDAGTVLVDAVADFVTLNAPDAIGDRNDPIPVTFTVNKGDATDGSETITGYQISGVPAGFSFSAGTNMGGGVWQFTPAQAVGLTMSSPLNFTGSTPTMTMTVYTAETNLGGSEVDFTDNTNQASDTFCVTWDFTVGTPTLNAPSVSVKEDNSVFIPITATLGDPLDSMKLTVSNIPAGWTVTAPGWTNLGGGVWEIQLATGQNYNGGITVAPPANSDADIPNMQVTAVESFGGDSATITVPVYVTTDAVADIANINAVDNSGQENTQLAVGITAGVTDLDGSETIVKYQITGVPAGFGFTSGTNIGGGVWEFTPAQIVGLKATAPTNYVGTINLNAVVFTAETNTSGIELDTSDNTRTTLDPFSLTWTNIPVNPPTVDVAGGTNTVITNEDTSVFMPITANNPNGAGSVMVVTMTIPSAPGWTINTAGWTSIGGGQYQITLNNGADYNGGITLTPPANSDVDFPGNISVTAAVTLAGDTVSATDAGTVIVDAVADVPTITADGSTGLENTSRPVTINAALTDTDGSETIVKYQISGVPAGFGFNQGTNLGGGVWEFTPAQIVGLQATSPTNFVGSINLVATVFNAETNTSGVEPDLTDNNNSNSDPLTITWTDTPINPPVVDVAGGTNTVITNEDTSVFLPIVATNPNGAGSVMVVTMTIPTAAGWTINTSGWTSLGGGQYQITLNNGADYNGGITLSPPAQSDYDFPGNISVTAAVTLAGNTVTATDAGTVIVDAVADSMTIDAGPNQTSTLNTQMTMNISFGASVDTDGSESHVFQVLGVPTGFSFNKGTNLGGGIWQFTEAQLSNLKISSTTDFKGNLDLTVRVINTETNTHGVEPDLTDNQFIASDTVRLTWVCNDTIPVVANKEHTITEISGVSGNLNAQFFCEGAATGGGYKTGNTFTYSGIDWDFLTSSCQKITVTSGSNSYVGIRADGQKVFELVINATTGDYTFTMYKSLDHYDVVAPYGVPENIVLNFGGYVEDLDGDRANFNIRINVKDGSDIDYLYGVGPAYTPASAPSAMMAPSSGDVVYGSNSVDDAIGNFVSGGSNSSNIASASGPANDNGSGAEYGFELNQQNTQIL